MWKTHQAVYPKPYGLRALTLPGLYETVSDSEAVRAEQSLRGAAGARARGHCLLAAVPRRETGMQSK